MGAFQRLKIIHDLIITPQATGLVTDDKPMINRWVDGIVWGLA